MIHTMTATGWQDNISNQDKEQAIKAIENGNVIFLPSLAFKLSNEEMSFLTPHALKGGAKNISFNANTDELKGSQFVGAKLSSLKAMMSRFVTSSKNLVNTIFPKYKDSLIMGRTSFRPIDIQTRTTSIRKDDTRLHVDAFPATPNQGKRILRVFCNINPEGIGRLWHLGEPFSDVVTRFSHVFKKPMWGSRRLLSLLKITKTYRSLYDHYMLLLHDSMKLDQHYQNTVAKKEFSFPAGSTWIVMTDSVSHAALSGQYMLEHTFYLPVEAMQDPELSPLRVLEKQLEP